jgi:putative membrane protein
MLDLVLAIAHHLVVFALVGLLAAELALIRPGAGGATLKALGAIDAAFGAFAGLILAIGFSRVYLGGKGPDFYLSNPMFWAKIAAFLVAGLVSILPTLAILQWRKAAKARADFTLSVADVSRARKALVLELAVFALIPVFAAAMARGYGL